MISALLMSATLSGGTKPKSTGNLKLIHETARSHIVAAQKKLAVATVHRDLDCLRAEVDFERVSHEDVSETSRDNILVICILHKKLHWEWWKQ